MFAYRLISRDTVEDKIVALQQSKRELADSIVGDHTVLRGVQGEVTLGDHSEVVGYPIGQENDGA